MTGEQNAPTGPPGSGVSTGPRSPVPGPRLSIMMLAPTPYFADRGCHVRIYEEARTLVGLGHDVRIVTYHIGRDMPGVPTCRIPSIPWYRRLTAGPSWHKPYLDILLFLRAYSLGRKLRPDVIHAHLHEGAFVGELLRPLLGVPVLFDYQGGLTAEMLDHGFMEKEGGVHRLFRRIEGEINRRADFIVTSSGAGCETLRNVWGIPAERVAPLTDGVDTERFTPHSRDKARRELHIPPDHSVVAYLGILNRYQGIDLLFDAMRIVRQQGVPIHFLVMGFPDEEYRNKAAADGLADFVTFTGKVDYGSVPRLLAAADLAVSPKISRTEANGKLLNYMACGIPSVVFDTPVNREILGDDGIYARYGDAADLASKIVESLGEPDRIESLKVRVRERAIREHSLHAMGAALVEIYHRVLRMRY